MPNVTIDWYAGRTAADKAGVAKGITEAFCKTINCPADAVIIVFHDVPKDSFAKGGKLASETPPAH
jgi:4-oxalocrotonate tautomerase